MNSAVTGFMAGRRVSGRASAQSAKYRPLTRSSSGDTASRIEVAAPCSTVLRRSSASVTPSGLPRYRDSERLVSHERMTGEPVPCQPGSHQRVMLEKATAPTYFMK